MKRYVANSRDVYRLMELHTAFAGTGPGRKHHVEVFNKSAVVLLSACWESLVEDMAEAAFALLLTEAKDHTAFPAKVLVEASRPVRADLDERAVWQLAGDGWKSVLKAHRDAAFDRVLRKFHSPNTEKVDDLYENLLGLRGLSTHWHWGTVTVPQATHRLDELVSLRGEIAHRVSASKTVRKRDVMSFGRFVTRLVVASHGAVAKHLERLLGRRQWAEYAYLGPK